MESYNTSNHSKYLIQYHIILTTKYRKPLLSVYGNDVIDIIKSIDGEFMIIEIGADKDHVHFLVSTKPHISAANIVKKVKAITTQKLWDLYPDKLKLDFWGKKKYHVFWSPSYFVSSVGAVDDNIIKHYIRNQGSNSSTQ